jgi:hypothetical protein
LMKDPRRFPNPTNLSPYLPGNSSFRFLGFLFAQHPAGPFICLG